MADVPARQYPDLQEHLSRLDKLNLLYTIDDEINKDKHLHPFVRWSYVSNIEACDRRGFYFTNVTDSNGQKYKGTCDVAVGTTAGQEKIYAAALGLDSKIDLTKDIDSRKLREAVAAKWADAFANPVAAVEIPSADAPVHEVVMTGDDLKGDDKGMCTLAVPNNTPGWDTAPYFSAGLWITQDPDTGRVNYSQNRVNVKASDRLSCMWLIQTGGDAHKNWVKYKARGEKMPVALIVGAPPVCQVIGPQKTPGKINDIDVAGGLAGVPMREVKAKTVPLMVPADANIIIEGWIDPTKLEMEAPFGESHGYMSTEEYNHSVQITAITKRKHAIITSMISELTPSESGVIKSMGYNAVMLNFLVNGIGCNFVKDVVLYDHLIGVSRFTTIVFENDTPKTEVWRALRAATVLMRSVGKITIGVSEDINPESMEEIMWAVAYRTDLPHDVQINDYQANGHAPKLRGGREWEAQIIIDATTKYPMPPVSLPKKQYMEEAKVLWEKAGLPPIKPVRKWFGYSLGDWCDEWDACAQRAVDGNWLANGVRTEKLVDTDQVGGPTGGVPNAHVVVYDEATGEVHYPDGFPVVDNFSTDQ
ncbi:MAG: UbiD family decarboxylase [Actinomycetes bacterium]